MEKLAKEKGCEIVSEWQKSMVNHLYWSAYSTTDGNGDVILERNGYRLLTIYITSMRSWKNIQAMYPWASEKKKVAKTQ